MGGVLVYNRCLYKFSENGLFLLLFYVTCRTEIVSMVRDIMLLSCLVCFFVFGSIYAPRGVFRAYVLSFRSLECCEQNYFSCSRDVSAAVVAPVLIANLPSLSSLLCRSLCRSRSLCVSDNTVHSACM